LVFRGELWGSYPKLKALNQAHLPHLANGINPWKYRNTDTAAESNKAQIRSLGQLLACV